MTSMREEVEETIDTLEMWIGDDESRQDIIEAFPNPKDLAAMCGRLYDLTGPGTPLGDLALAMWPDAPIDSNKPL